MEANIKKIEDMSLNAWPSHKMELYDVLELECTIIKQKGPVAVAEAKATVDGKAAVTAELTFALAPNA